MNPLVKTGLTHLGTFIGGSLAVFTFAATKKADLYALWDQLNVVIAAITQLIAIATPLATTAYGIYRTSTKNRLSEMVDDPNIKGVITTKQLANSPTLADEAKVQSSVAKLPDEAQVSK